MADEKDKKEKNQEEIKFLSKEDLKNKRFRISIEVPKEDLDELLKEMMGVKDGYKKVNK